ncbi:MAG: phosphatidylserine decarboxylase, partial [Acidobacteriota bacterium]
MVRDAYPFLLPLGILALLCLGLAWFFEWLLIPGGILVLLAAFVAFFFRDPERSTPAEAGAIVSPADGKVVRIGPAPAGELGPGVEGTQVSIFLSVLDVHINRAPLGGKVTSVNYRRGRFMVAMDHRASVENEQNVVAIEDDTVRVVFKQIAGLIARRIVFSKNV